MTERKTGPEWASGPVPNDHDHGDHPELSTPDRHSAAEFLARVAGLAVFPVYGIRDDLHCTCGDRECKNAGKHPMTWRGFRDATTDLDVIESWWRRYWPLANIGIRIPAGQIVLDVDTRHLGHVMLNHLMRRHGPLPDTRTARTGSGGWHLWLAYDGPTRGKLCPGVDVKTNLGYVVAPPSKHASGNLYAWENWAPVAPASEWIGQLLNPPEPPAPKVEPRQSDDDDPLARLVGFIQGAPEGERNDRLYWAACRAYETGLRPGRLIEAAISAGLDRRSSERTVLSALRAPQRGR